MVGLFGRAPQRRAQLIGLRSRARARSSSVFRIESGVRSSWLASSMKRRSVSTDAWIRSRRSFIVAPSRVISSSAGGRDRRPRRSADEIVGRLAPHALDRRQARRPPATMRRATAGARRSGTPIPSVTASCNSWSARSWSEVPTITTALPVGVCTGAANSRLTLSIPGSSRSKNVGLPRSTGSRRSEASLPLGRSRSSGRSRRRRRRPARTPRPARSSPEPTSTDAGPLFRASTTRIAARDRRPASTVSSRSAAVRR